MTLVVPWNILCIECKHGLSLIRENFFREMSTSIREQSAVYSSRFPYTQIRQYFV